MKRLWTAISFLAVVNLGAMALFTGWLYQSGRLDLERVRALRDLLAPTIAEAESARRAVEDEAAAEEAAGTEAWRRNNPPLPSDAQIERISLIRDQTAQAIRRLDDRTDQHLHELNLRAQHLEQREAQFKARQQAWEESIAVEADQRRDEQFRQTVALYESLAGEQAKRMLMELVRQEGGRLDRAVGYLRAMEQRAATKTLKALKTAPENELATRLLERLRTYGLEAVPAETDGNVDGDPTD